MNRPKLTLTIASALVLGALLGGGAMYVFFLRDAMSGMISLGDLSVASMYETRLEYFGDSGSDKDYEATLNEYATVLDRLRARHPNSEDNASLSFSKITTLSRLSIVATKRGGSPESDQSLRSAMSECQAAKWRDCSAEQLRKLGLYFESRRSGTPTSNPK
jgi:hypothetical protein